MKCNILTWLVHKKCHHEHMSKFKHLAMPFLSEI